MEIAKRLEKILSRGGAVVALSRRGEETISMEERIYKINRFGPDLAVRVCVTEGDGEETAACTLSHYPGSEKGMEFAAELSSRLGGLPPCDEWIVRESAARFLQQTSCPAVEICGGSLESAGSESVLSNPLHAQMESERIAAAIIALAGGEPIEQEVTVIMEGAPIEGAAISIDQAMTRLTDASGSAEFACVLPGNHLLTILIPGETIARLIPLSVTDGSRATITLTQ